jgi:hypothetical protein
MFPLMLHVYLLHLIILIVDSEIYKLCDLGLCGKGLSAEIHLNDAIEKYSFISQKTYSVFIIKIKHLILCGRRAPFCNQNATKHVKTL